jgi:hypothetical protein
LVVNPERKRPLGRLRCIWKVMENSVESGLHSTGSEKGPVAGSCEHGKECVGLIKGGRLLAS